MMVRNMEAAANRKLRIYSGFSTDVGKRQHNEDAWLQSKVPVGYLAAVADGMGGHSHGDQAAAITLASIVAEVEAERTDPSAALLRGFLRANRAVRNHAGTTCGVVGAACVAAVICQGNLYVGHVGDARAYLLRGSSLYGLTRDHSLLQEIVDMKGQAAATSLSSNLRHIMSRSVGAEENISPSIRPPIALNAGDALLLCSDGLTKVIDDTRIRRTLAGATPREAAARLVQMAKGAGGEDNVTAVVLRIDSDALQRERTLVTLDELTAMLVRTADGDLHPVKDVIINPSTWAVASLRLDLRVAERATECDVPISDIGPMRALEDGITTPQRTEALLDMFQPRRR